MRKKLSVVILTLNSSKKIRKCLESVKWADEIVIIDGGSVDETLRICREYTDKIYVRPYAEDFSEERNFGTQVCSGDWILQLDSDEVVEFDFREKILEILEKDPPFYAYKFLRKNYFLGHFMKHGGWLHHSLHFFRKGYAYYKGKIHETLIVKDNKIGILNVGVRHYPFDSIREFIERQNRYTTLQAQRIYDEQGLLPESFVKYQIKIRTLKLFFKMFFKKKGYREGIYGLVFTGLFCMVHFLKWAKYWEFFIKNKGIGCEKLSSSC